MMLLSYDELVGLVDCGVIDALYENINGASIDVRLDDILLLEAASTKFVIDPSIKESHAVTTIKLKDSGFILPPGGCVLASTMETFNLPNDIACEFKLKSSIARVFLNCMLATWCFVGDTKIPLLDGSSVCISDLSKIDDAYVYSMNKLGEVVPGKVLSCGITAFVKDTVKVYLDSGESFECTPDHLIMLRNGKYIEASMLSNNDALMPLYRRTGFYGHEEIYSPSFVPNRLRKNKNRRWRPTHRVVYEKLIGDLDDGFVVHHKDHCKTNNHPNNLRLMDAKEHFIHHSREYTSSQENRERASRHASELNQKLWHDDQYIDYRNKKSKQASEQISEYNKKRWSNDDNKKSTSDWAKKNNVVKSLRKFQTENPKLCRSLSISGKFKKNIERMISSKIDINESSYISNKQQSSPSLKSINEVYGSFEKALHQVGYMNHKVCSVETIHRDIAIPVYDMEIETYHNFAIESGVFVHNCDPTWHNSKLTLELKNDLKHHSILLKAGMKIGQMIFYRVKPVPTEHSYKAKGRYNNTTSVTQSKGV